MKDKFICNTHNSDIFQIACLKDDFSYEEVKQINSEKNFDIIICFLFQTLKLVHFSSHMDVCGDKTRCFSVKM